jgi:hypothetical protein
LFAAEWLGWVFAQAATSLCCSMPPDYGLARIAKDGSGSLTQFGFRGAPIGLDGDLLVAAVDDGLASFSAGQGQPTVFRTRVPGDPYDMADRKGDAGAYLVQAEPRVSRAETMPGQGEAKSSTIREREGNPDRALRGRLGHVTPGPLEPTTASIGFPTAVGSCGA